jgi:putative tryptophan/tyrosine transport system substrate-binding protein
MRMSAAYGFRPTTNSNVRVNRRQVVAALCAVPTLCPLKALAQKPAIVIGFLGGQIPQGKNSRGEALIEGLRSNGLIVGRDFVLVARFSGGDDERFPELARELAKSKARMILANTPAAVRGAQQLDPPIPVVMTYVNDPIGAGLISSLAHPGNHTTGTANLNEAVTLKALELAKEMLPGSTRIGVLHNPRDVTHDTILRDLSLKSSGLGVDLIPIGLRPHDDLNALFSRFESERLDAVQLLGDPSIIETLHDQLGALALRQRMPIFSTSAVATEAGGLFSYGAPVNKILLRTGYYVKRILDGAEAGELPVEQPTEVILVINLKTAKAIGVDVPPALLARADLVME